MDEEVMNMKKLFALFLSLAFVLSLFAACGGSSMNSISKAEIAEAPAAMAESAAGDTLTSSTPNGSSAVPENRKWIITVHMEAETDDLDAMTAALDVKITELKGYVEDQSIHNGSAYASRRYRNAHLTIRIPADQVDSFTEQVSGIANVVSQEKSLKDITLQYVDTESHIAALETEQARLLELLAQAETMSDLLEIESRLTEVRYSLESYNSQLRSYDNRVNYATIHLSISEVQEYTPVEEPTLWERITGGFTESMKELWQSLQNLLVWIIVTSPFLVVYGGILLAIFFLSRCLRKHIKPLKKRSRKTPPSQEKTE